MNWNKVLEGPEGLQEYLPLAQGELGARRQLELPAAPGGNSRPDDRKDLPVIVRALMMMGHRDDDDKGDDPPSLPGH